MKVLIDIISILAHAVEAAIEAITGDRKHWISASITFAGLLGLHLVFLDYALDGEPWMIVVSILFALLEAFESWLIGRVYFDQMYAWFSGLHWSFLGSTAKSDLRRKKLRKYIGGAKGEFILRTVILLGVLIFRYWIC